MYNCECGADLIQEDCETIIGVCQESPVVKDYNALVNKPQINGVTLQGNKTSEDLGIAQEIADAVSAEATLRENADTALGGRIDGEITAREGADTALGGRIDNANTRIDNEILARQGADHNLQTQIDAITSKSDVVDVVANYQALLAYDTSKLNDNDVIKVLDDETHDDALTYYRWSTATQTWSYIGQEAPYYSKGQMDIKLAEKQDKLIAGANIQIAQDGKTISATDTTYTAGNGLNLNGTEFSADTTVLATKSDLDRYYTKTETDTKIAPKLETEVVSTLPATGDEGKLYLTPKTYTTGSASGNPITIALGEDEGAIDSFKLDGDTYQQSYSGKNMIGFPTRSYELHDLTFDFGADGTITINGTRSETTATNYNSSVLFNFSAGDITFTIIPISGSFSGANIGYRAVTGNAQAWYQVVSSVGGYNQGTITKTAEQVSEITRIELLIGSGTAVFNNFKFKLQVTAGSDHDADYEPFVGGQPSPSPSYPEPIQTVTGEQTITIGSTTYPLNLGKNLFDKSSATPKTVLNGDGSLGLSNDYSTSDFISVKPSNTYYKSQTSSARFKFYSQNKTPLSSVYDDIPVAGSPQSFTTPSNCFYIRFSFATTTADNIQIEAGSTATSYAPYMTPIELCKLSTYQDYIWKDGDVWKVHKATGSHTFDGSESWTYDDDRIPRIYLSENALNSINIHPVIPSSTSSQPISKITNFTAKTFADFYTNAQGDGFAMSTVGRNIQMGDNGWTSRDGAVAKVIGAKWYYAQATSYAIDTTITDQNLINQLEAVLQAKLQASNTITNTATGTNLAGDMELNYHEYDPHSRYNKWLWLDINENYEQIGS